MIATLILDLQTLISLEMMRTIATDIAVVSTRNINDLRFSKELDSIQRRGSLPFKKRRHFCESYPQWNQTPKNTEHNDHTKYAMPSLPCNIQSDERVDALAIASTATDGFPLTRSALSESQLVSELLGPPPVTPTGTDTSSILKSFSDGNSRRLHHPPLATPLPGGCHGRTSRNNSFCRRQPCYNGSKFCKLHHQQYTIASIHTTVGDSVLSDCPGLSDSSTPAPPSARQDKRYTGCDDEVRCRATTTRGRPCAYVSVIDSKYCFLHADYDTNPPPRRGGSGSTPKQAEVLSVPLGDITGYPSMPDLSKSAKVLPTLAVSARIGPGECQTPSVESDDSLSISSSQSDMEGKKPTPQLIKCSHSLLSSISSDQWLDKVVMVGLGPLVNRLGKIVKWGNGWVTVRILSDSNQGSDGLLHNRRSVELFLLPSDQQTSGLHSEEESHQQEHRESPFIKRCVSGEADEARDFDFSGQVHAPRQLYCKDVLFAHKDKHPRKVSYLSDHNEESSPVVCTALIGEKESNHDVSVSDASKLNIHSIVSMDERVSDTLCLDSDVDIEKDGKSSHFNVEALRSPEFAHRSQSGNNNDKECPISHSSCGDAHVPPSASLSEFLVQAQNGLISKSALGLLFGTAALERGRRTVYKPRRYEDMGLNNKSPRSPRRTKG